MAFTSKPENAALLSRIEDTVRLCDKHNAPCFLGFLDEQEQAQARRILPHHTLAAQSFRFYGGNDEAERCILGVFPDYLEPEDTYFPMQTVAFCYREARQLTHRDFLGTLLSLGIRRDTIGDILCGNGLTVVFLREEIAPFVCEQVTKIGGEGVETLADYTGELPAARTYLQLSETIASPRLDAVVKALLHVSRDEASRQIRAGGVSLDHCPTEDISATVRAPSTVSVRGSGRFIIDQVGPQTKKGRLVLLARKCV